MKNYQNVITNILNLLDGNPSLVEDANKAIDNLISTSNFTWYPTYVACDNDNQYLFTFFAESNYLDLDEFKEECDKALHMVQVLTDMGKNCVVFFIVEQVSDVVVLKKYLPKEHFGILHNEFAPALIEYPIGALSTSQDRLLLQPLRHLANAKNIKGKIAEILKDFSKDYLTAKRSADDDYERVKDLINSLLNCDSRFKLPAKSIQLIKLVEDILSKSIYNLRDHYFHACNTMIIGFVIMDIFYMKFCEVCHWKEDETVPEFIWIVTSLYHDIGYPAAFHTQMLVETYDAENHRQLFDTRVRQLRQDLWENEYETLAQILENLFSHICGADASPWEYDGFSHAISSEQFIFSLESSFIETGSHGAQGGLILMSKIDKAIRKITNQRDRKYFYRHIALAALSILFHDVSVRNICRKKGINYVYIANFPFASLLTFVDILQDDRRDLSGAITRPDIFKDVIPDGTGISVHLNKKVIDSSRKSKLYDELKEAFEFFVSNGLRFTIPLELRPTQES